MNLFILKNSRVVPATLDEWTAFVESGAHSAVAKWQVGGVQVLTGFRGIADEDPARLWLTLVCGGKFDGKQERHATERAARRGHVEMVKYISRHFYEESDNGNVRDRRIIVGG